MQYDKYDNYDALCRDILNKDSSIRFVGIANSIGNLVGTAYRKDLIPLLTNEETSQYAIKAVLRAATREDFELNLGKLQYSIGKYEKLVRATVPIPTPKEDADRRFYLLLSFDVDSNVKSIIEDKILS